MASFCGNFGQLFNISRVIKRSLEHRSFFSYSISSSKLTDDHVNSCNIPKVETGLLNKDDIQDFDIKKSVFISQSHDIFSNLALEDWLYRNFDFKHHRVLLLWVNKPSVVIGRHQNPFTAANLTKLADRDITLARRNTGGGAVYHDNGSLNCTFYTPRARNNPKYNLSILTRALFREWGIRAESNNRHDIIVNEKKISVTAAKLGHSNAYQHCTLFVNVNKLNLVEAFTKTAESYIEKSNTSVQSPVQNVCDIERSVNIPQLISAVGYEFLRTLATELEDGGNAQAMKQRGFQLVNPNETWFPGIKEIRQKFSSWEWVFGKTPKFTVAKDLLLKVDDEQQLKIQLNVEVENGLMSEIIITMPSGRCLPVVSELQNTPYTANRFSQIIESLKLIPTDNIKQLINSM